MIFLIEGAFAKGQQRKGRPVPDLIRGVGFPWPVNSDFSRPAIVGPPHGSAMAFHSKRPRGCAPQNPPARLPFVHNLIT